MEYTIIVIEDDTLMAKTIAKKIESGSTFSINVIICNTENEFYSAMRSNSVDLVVSDYKLSTTDFNGEKVIEHAHNQLGIPVIIISGFIGEEMAAKLMRLGASDLVIKDSPERLVPAIERELKEYYYRKDHLKQFQKAYNLLSQMASSVNWIMKHDISEISLKRILKDYTSIVEADRSYLFEKKIDNDNKVYYEQIVDYCIGKSLVGGISCQGWVGKIYENDSPYFFKKLVDGPNGVSFLVSELPEEERKFFYNQGIKSIAYIPVYTPQDNIWGFFGFDDCTKTRVWSNIELKALESVSAIIGTILYKMKHEEFVQTHVDSLITKMNDMNSKLNDIKHKYSVKGVEHHGL